MTEAAQTEAQHAVEHGGEESRGAVLAAMVANFAILQDRRAGDLLGTPPSGIIHAATAVKPALSACANCHPDEGRIRPAVSLTEPPTLGILYAACISDDGPM